LSNKSKKWNN